MQALHDATFRALAPTWTSPTPFDTPLPAAFAYSIAVNHYTTNCPTAHLLEAHIPLIPRLDHPVFARPDPSAPPPKVITFFHAPKEAINAAPSLYLAWIGQLGKVIYTNATRLNDSSGVTSPPPLVKEWIAKGTVFGIITDQATAVEPEDVVGCALAGPSEIILS
jgi:hypothetical protein